MTLAVMHMCAWSWLPSSPHPSFTDGARVWPDSGLEPRAPHRKCTGVYGGWGALWGAFFWGGSWGSGN